MSGQAPYTPPGPIDVTYTSKTTPHEHVIVVAPKRHGWRIPEVINPSLRSVVPTQDKNVYTYYEQLMALRRACEALGLELVEMSEDLTPPFTEEDANKVLMISADGKTKIWKTSTATGIDATVEQLPDGAKITIVNSGVLSEATVYNGAKGERGSDGFTPTVDIQQLPDGITITVTDAQGTKTATITNGAKGDPGFSPSARVERVDGGALVTVTDETGTTSSMINDGTNGTSGSDGRDGVSPTATVTQTSPNTVSFTVTDANGTTTATLSGEAGQDGRDGVDGVSPTVSLTQLQNGVEVTVTDKNGTQSQTILNGRDGSSGTDGRDGVDGVSPTATVTQVTQNSVRFDVTDKNGTTSATLTGEAGQDGQDGFSPSASVTQDANGATINITDKTGSTSASIMNGAKGDSGEGVPAGGTTGQQLRKKSDNDYDTEWFTPENPEFREYQFSYVKKSDNKWYTQLTDGTDTQEEPVPEEWYQGGTPGGSGNEFVAEYGVTSAQDIITFLESTDPKAPMVVKRNNDYYTVVTAAKTAENVVVIRTFASLSGEYYLFIYTITDGTWASSSYGLQKLLQSGVNIKTVGGVSVLGSGDIPITAQLDAIILNSSSTYSDFSDALAATYNDNKPVYWKNNGVFAPVICFGQSGTIPDNYIWIYYFDDYNKINGVGKSTNGGSQTTTFDIPSGGVSVSYNTPTEEPANFKVDDTANSAAVTFEEGEDYKSIKGEYNGLGIMNMKLQPYRENLVMGKTKPDGTGEGSTVIDLGTIYVDNTLYHIYQFYMKVGPLTSAAADSTFDLTPTLANYDIASFVEFVGVLESGQILNGARDNNSNDIIAYRCSKVQKTITIKQMKEYTGQFVWMRIAFIGNKTA